MFLYSINNVMYEKKNNIHTQSFFFHEVNRKSISTSFCKNVSHATVAISNETSNKRVVSPMNQMGL